MKRTTFAKKSTAKAHRRELIKQRTKTRRANAPKKVRGLRLTVVWPDNVAPF